MTPNVVVLTLDPEIAKSLHQILGMRAAAGAIVVRTVVGSIGAAIEAARRELGPLPLGVAARSRAEAFEAIEAGADEAMALAPDDRADVLELIDRTRLRGGVRAELERERRDVAHADKLAALGTLVSGVAHELNNPLGAIVLLLDLLPRERGGLGDVAADLRRSVATIQDVVKDLRVFARDGDAEQPEVISIPETVDHLLRLVGADLRAVAIVERDFAADLPEVVLPLSRFTQVLTNVIVNATHAMRELKRDTHRLRITGRADENNVALSISDTGPGIPAEAIDRIFDPFYTTKRESFGTGLGLSISRNLMRKMGGDLLVESVYGEGATFLVLMPRVSATELRDARVRARVIPGALSTAGRRSVLVAGDDETLLRVYARVLERSYDVVVANDAQEGIDLLASGCRADVVLLDFVGTEGTRLAIWAKDHRPELARRLIVIADDGEVLRRSETLAALQPRLVTKPTPAVTLIAAIEAALAS